MAFTPDGARTIWEILAGQSDDSLVGGALQVSDGSQKNEAAIDSMLVTDNRLTLAATFDERTANHAWSERSVLTANGVVIDVETSDGGRKTQGSVWRLEIDLDLVVSKTAETD